jgi:hypothetical protein
MLLPFTVLLILTGLAIISREQLKLDIQNMPSLPKPIAVEMALITSAGQSTDTYIVKDIANKLMIHNYFMPQAQTIEMDDINSIVFVIGYSEISEMLFGTDYKTEVNRIKNLIAESKEKKLKIISVFIGGEHRKDARTLWFLTYIGENSDYIITTSDGDRDQNLYHFARERKIPITVVNKLDDISEPFASAFR